MCYIIPTCGLGNRLRCIASAFRLKQRLDTKVVCLWVPDQGLNCSFEDLFEPVSIVRECGEWFPSYIFRRLRLLKKCLSRYDGFDVLTDYENKRLVDIVGYDITSGEKKRLVVANSFSEFMDTTEVDYKDLFRPSAKVNELIHSIYIWGGDKSISKAIGLHIRRSDNAESIRVSPLGAFESRIQAGNRA